MPTISKNEVPFQLRVPEDLVRRVKGEAGLRGLRPRDIVIEALEKTLPKKAEPQRKAS